MAKIIGVHTKPNIPQTYQSFTSSGNYNRSYIFFTAPGNVTVGDTYTNNGVTYTVKATAASANQIWMTGANVPTNSGQLVRASGSGDATLTFIGYATPSSLLIKVQGGGAGGGGAGGSPTTGTAGNTSSFGSLVSCPGGVGGQASGVGGVLGTAPTVSAPAIQLTANVGGTGGSTNGSTSGSGGGRGGDSAYGGGATGGAAGIQSAQNAINQTGAGGGGAFLAAASGAGGGSAGSYAEALVYNPAVTYVVTVGATASGGTGTNSGGNGGSGFVEVFENYG